MNLTDDDELAGPRISVEQDKKLLLITNDDGIHATGIEALAEALSPLGQVVMIAPDRNRSGVGHAISLHDPLRSHQHGPNRFSVEGTPADCVYLAVHQLLPRKPDILISGINAGPNLSYDVHYSGTVGAAFEGTLLGIDSVAVSLIQPKSGYARAAEFVHKLVLQILAHRLPRNTTLNVNVPGGAPTRWQTTFLGHRLFRHAVHPRRDPRGGSYFWIGGVPDQPHDIPGSDCNAVAEGLISVTPLAVDFTDRAQMSYVGKLALDFEAAPSVPPPADLDACPTE